MITLTITGGAFRGRKIRAVPNEVTRYTPERVRLALFSILGQHCDIAACRFCDLCAGSGVVGIEALSRGATFAEFYDMSRLSVKTIIATVQEFGLKDRAQVYCRNLLTARGKPSLGAEVVFIDPPFHTEIAEKFFLTFANEPAWMLKNALLMIEYSRTVPDITGFVKIGEYRYGTVFLNLFRKE
ncbi:MAG: RsmD family RNA methyltransferase [Thermotogota bacterium]|nr:RsmD family RNA methyltransferase [Thermotogota bacterium]HNR63383.1 RsmD family RNA methyltransferase [Thermotogota bacterium]